MERESFEDPQVARILNCYFVSIKVDREERPDIDAVYMNATQMLTGGGGWPMSVFLDGDKRPFYAGTYFPKEDGRHGIGFITLLERLAKLWSQDRDRLTDVAEKITAGLESPVQDVRIDYQAAIHKGYRQLQQRFDSLYGGFGGAPKFPTPHNLMFLLRYHYAYQEPQALAMVEKTLTSMYRGGIYDHVGGGFSRYSTDSKWLAPHFEKMLYDNALLAIVYTESFLVTRNPLYRRITTEILSYIARDMTSPHGAFYSAEDADSQGEEGKFYTFSKAEILAALGREKGESFSCAYDISVDGNFEGKNILNLIANDNYRTVLDDSFFRRCLDRLYASRQKRVRPLRDDKILASWNGLMIYAMAYAGRVLGCPEYIQRAKAAADFVLGHMVDSEGKLMTRYREGEARFRGVADDYAYVVMGLIEVYQASLEVKYLAQANRLNQILLDDFFEDGALFQTSREGETLISRPRELYDGALPSYNSVSIVNFIKLAHLWDAPHLLKKADDIVAFFGADIKNFPIQFTFALWGMMYLALPQRHIVLTGDDSRKLTHAVCSKFQPFTTLCHVNEALGKHVAFYQGFANRQTPAAYLCEGVHCEAPIFNLNDLERRLDRTPNS